MKMHKSVLFAITSTILLGLHASCGQEKVDPAIYLDEVFIPEGYAQIDNPPAEAQARLEELRLENPKEHFYYLKRDEPSSKNWIFPQRELKIESVSYNEKPTSGKRNEAIGVIVKKIRGDYRNEEFIIIENQPAPKNGMKEFYKHVQENIHYPVEAKKAGIHGRVFVEFVVDTNGKLTQVKAIKGIGAGCDEEAVRVIEEAPVWNPGKVVDMPVKVRMILPISYNLN
jgi:TonB family protein